MQAVDLIIKKRNGGKLTKAEIGWFIEGFMSGAITDYQASAWAMAVFFRGMDAEETVALTSALAESGKQLYLNDIAQVVADKHSTGGVGDKTTLILAPLVAAAGLPVAKLSGRGLGYFGGTVDKLETIPGFRATLSEEEFRQALKKNNLVVAGQSHELAPADGKMYSLRDVTGTVESLPLIAASVMSKKIAAGANCICLDVKYGKGAFMKTLEEATALAEAMVDIGKGVGRKVKAALSSMEQPLGFSIGNALEVKEAVATLTGSGAPDLLELCYTLGAELLVMGGITPDQNLARATLEKTLESGLAFAKLKTFVANQGGDTSVLDNPEKLPLAPHLVDLASTQTGYIATMDAEQIGIAGYLLGTGRKVKTDKIDPSVGLVLYKKIGDRVEVGEPLLQIHANSAEKAAEVREGLLAAYRFNPAPVTPPPLIEKIIG
jgi:pyrimidine-nucleoside phosphorylase